MYLILPLLLMRFILPPCFVHASMARLFDLISVIPPVTPLYSMGIHTFLDILTWKSLTNLLLLLVVPSPTATASVWKVNNLSLMMTNRFEFAKFLYELYMSVSSRSVTVAPTPLHCLSQSRTILIVSCAMFAAESPTTSIKSSTNSKFILMLIFVIVIFRPMRCDSPVPAGMSIMVRESVSGPALVKSKKWPALTMGFSSNSKS